MLPRYQIVDVDLKKRLADLDKMVNELTDSQKEKVKEVK